MSQQSTETSPYIALARTAEALAGELSLDDVLDAVVDAAIELTGAQYGALGVIGEGGGGISRFLYKGIDDETARRIGPLPRGEGILGLLIRDPQTLRLDDLSTHPASVGFPASHPPMTTFLGTPVRSGGRVFGNLYLTDKPGGFLEQDEHLLEVLAVQAGAAIENAILSDRLQELAIQEERDRISRDLHDGIIQTLFSIGMGLESARALTQSAPERVAARLDSAVDAIDSAIRELRNTIFRLRPHEAASLGMRRGVIELAREYEVNALVRPQIDLPLDLDALVPARIVPDALQVIREALSNAAKHARASTVRVSASVADGRLQLEIVDDGSGFDVHGAGAGHGLENIRERAELHGGEATVESEAGVGTTVAVKIPINQE